MRTYTKDYLFRGLLGIPFSMGLDTYNDHFLSGKGNVYRWGAWKEIAEQAVEEYRLFLSENPNAKVKITVYGHSLGARAAIKFANYLYSRGVDVQTVILLDYVDSWWQPDLWVKDINVKVIHFRSNDFRAKHVPGAHEILVHPLNHIQMDDSIQVMWQMYFYREGGKPDAQKNPDV